MVKTGANNADKVRIRRLHKQGRDVEYIARRLRLQPRLVVAILAADAAPKEAPAPVPPAPETPPEAGADVDLFDSASEG